VQLLKLLPQLLLLAAAAAAAATGFIKKVQKKVKKLTNSPKGGHGIIKQDFGYSLPLVES